MKKRSLFFFLMLALGLPWAAQAQFSGSGTESDPYLISSSSDWSSLASKVNSGTNYSGKYFRLTSDITISGSTQAYMVGTMSGETSSGNAFSGNFNGDGHTITISYSTSSGFYYTAPFRYISGATIKNVKVAGTMNVYKFMGSLVGYCLGTNNIENCVSEVAITGTISGDATMGGLISHVHGGTTNIRGCVFKGKLLGSSSNSVGGFIGWTDHGSAYSYFYDCVFAPSQVTVSTTNSATFSRGNSSNSSGIYIYNSFYTQTHGTTQGSKLQYTITAGSNVSTVALGNNPVVYNLSGITGYNSSSGYGIKYNNTIYAASGNSVKLDLSSTLTNPQYSASAGTLTGSSNPYSLTMPSSNTTISATEGGSGGGDDDGECEDFESVTAVNSASTAGNMPDGWDYIYTGSNTGYSPKVYNGTSYKPSEPLASVIGSNRLMMIAGSSDSYGENTYVILPNYNNAITGISFNAWRENADYGTLYFGYITNASDASTFHQLYQLTTVAYGNATASNASFSYDNLSIPTGARLAFRWNHTSSWYSAFIDNVCVTTVVGPASLPYTENFENGQNGWEFGNDNQTNYWMVGSNTSYSSSNSLYITNNGSANAYSNSTSYVYAYRKLNIPSAGDYVVSFKWKANGESTWDLLRAFMIPVSANPTLTGGTNNGQSGSSNTTPTGWIDVANPSGKLNLQTTWQSSDKAVNLSTAGEYYLVFFWKNDGGVANTPPAAVDDIDIHEAATYNVTVSANGSGTVSGGGNNIVEGSSVTVTATPNASNFINWTENGTEVSTNPSYTFTLEGDRNLVANFEEWTVSIASEPASLVNLPYGTEVVLTASNNVLLQSLGEYRFSTGVDASKWYDLNSYTNISVSDGDSYASSLQNIGFTFTFAGTQYTQFSVNSDGNLRLGGTVTGTGNYTTPFSSTNANANNPKINGMGFDGYFVASSNYVRKQVFGEAPNRVLVVEFKESPYSSSYRQYTWNWQVQLSEDGTIQIVYGNTAPGSYNYSNQIGLCVNANDGWTVSTTTHEATHFTNGTTTTNTSANSWPGTNRYYRFSPVTYEWTYTGTAGTANGNVYTVTPTENSSYTVSVTLNGTTLTETVEVTMQALTKTIAAYSNSQAEKGGYYLIASPLAAAIAPTDVDGMITDNLGNTATTSNSTYDLYSFNQAAALEWQNYRASNFNLVNGTGYLYASKEGTTLTFSGAPYSGTTKTVTLSKTEAATGLEFPDWNLVGNPFAFDDAYITKSFYTLENSDTYTLNTAGTAIHPMQGLLAVAYEDGETLTFSTVAPAINNSKLNMNVSNEHSVVDQAIISFNEGQQLPKLQFRNGSTKVYLPKDGKEYAIVSTEAMGTMPVNFKAENDGTYTLSFTAEEVSFSYLHLIDNMTGNDVDLLATPSYSFDAKTTDYESRFKLVFATGNNANDDAFAFFSNGSFVINNEGNATLQVIDVNGRILKNESINGCANVNVKAAAGVYVLRLVNGNDVKVQKVVVR